MPFRKQRLFISFDFDNDKILRGFIVGQARNPDSPFEIEDWSMKKAAPQKSGKLKHSTELIDQTAFCDGRSKYL